MNRIKGEDSGSPAVGPEASLPGHGIFSNSADLHSLDMGIEVSEVLADALFVGVAT